MNRIISKALLQIEQPDKGGYYIMEVIFYIICLGILLFFLFKFIYYFHLKSDFKRQYI